MMPLTFSILSSLLLLAALPTMAELPMEAPLEGKLSPTLPSGLTPAPPAALPVQEEAPVARDEAPQPASGLSEAEQRIRVGIVMLGRLLDLMSSIKDDASAEAAVAPIMRASAEFQAWAQSFSSLPPLDADTQLCYEKRFLPVIDELNTRIKIQGERIASAEFYGSRDLPAALVRLVTSMQ